MTLAPRTRDAVRRHWADRLGCAPAAFEEAGVTLTERSGRTVRLLRRDGATVLTAPKRVRAALSTQLDMLGDRPLTAAVEIVRRALSGESTDVVEGHGPSVLSYVDASSVAPVASDASLLEADDEQAFRRLRGRVPDSEWNRASPTFRPGRTAGLFRGGELVAAASLDDSAFPDIGVVVHPDHRDAGYGQQVVSRVLTAAFEREAGAVPRYRTPERELASLSLAASLGFERWASETVVVLD